METISQAAGSVEFPLDCAWRLAAVWGPRGCPLYGRQRRIVARGSLNTRLVESRDFRTLRACNSRLLRSRMGTVARRRHSRPVGS
jgi:hypothetical protein